MSNERILAEIGSLVRNFAQGVDRLVSGGTATPATPVAPPVEQTRGVTISLRVQGRIPASGVGYQVNSAVERVLSELAAEQGVTVVPGSVRVNG